jgi:hypothetical protein
LSAARDTSLDEAGRTAVSSTVDLTKSLPGSRSESARVISGRPSL